MSMSFKPTSIQQYKDGQEIPNQPTPVDGIRTNCVINSFSLLWNYMCCVDDNCINKFSSRNSYSYSMIKRLISNFFFQFECVCLSFSSACNFRVSIKTVSLSKRAETTATPFRVGMPKSITDPAFETPMPPIATTGNLEDKQTHSFQSFQVPTLC